MVGFFAPSTAPLWLDLVGLCGNLVVLAISGDQFVIALARISASVRVRPTVAAALVGGLGTSVAELIVARASLQPSRPAWPFGSLVGSIVANVCLALAVATLIRIGRGLKLDAEEFPLPRTRGPGQGGCRRLAVRSVRDLPAPNAAAYGGRAQRRYR
jgi:hypothetical protein